jgi:hypothetical protein
MFGNCPPVYLSLLHAIRHSPERESPERGNTIRSADGLSSYYYLSVMARGKGGNTYILDGIST